ncbi:MAG TPA: glycosyltransferase family 39 protein [Prolixibacteraceae bacterium]|nr:glycosyltransferase family 39 protein [Prolixibacteraceae bacterium]
MKWVNNTILGNKKNFSDTWIIILLVLINIALKSVYLTDYNIDLDEPFSLFHSQQTLRELFSIFKNENNPPFHFLILHFWIKLFGIGPLSARILPMLTGSFAVIFIYKLGKKFLNFKSGIVAALLYTFSNSMIMEAHDCRVYSLFVLLTAASMYFYMSLIQEPKTKRYLFALTITNICLLYSHFLAFLLIGLQLFFLLLNTEIRKKAAKPILLSFFFAFLAYLPYASLFLVRFMETSVQGTNQPQLNFVNAYSTFFVTFGNGFLVSNLYLALIVSFLAGIVLKKIRLSVHEIIFAGWFVGVYLASFLISFKFPIVTTPRYLVFIVPGFFLFVIIAVNRLFVRDKFLHNAMLAFVVLLMLSSIDLYYSNKMEAEKTVRFIKENKSDSTLVYVVPPWVAYVFAYHYDLDIFKDYRNFDERLHLENIYLLSSASGMDTSLFQNASDILLLDGWGNMSYVDPELTIMNSLESNFGTMDQQTIFQSYGVYHFSKTQ